MKLLIATVALATVLASPAFAKTRGHATDPQAQQSYGQVQQNQRPYVRQAPASAYGWQRGGETDPDPRIRDYLKYDPPNNYN